MINFSPNNSFNFGISFDASFAPLVYISTDVTSFSSISTISLATEIGTKRRFLSILLSAAKVPE